MGLFGLSRRYWDMACMVSCCLFYASFRQIIVTLFVLRVQVHKYGESLKIYPPRGKAARNLKNVFFAFSI